VSEEHTTPDLVELSRQANDAFNRRDLDALMRLFATDAVMLGATNTYVGASAIRGLWEAWFDAFEHLHIELDEHRDLGNGVSFSIATQVARPIGSSGEVQQRLGFARVTGADGLCVRLEAYPEIEDARAAAERLAEERG